VQNLLGRGERSEEMWQRAHLLRMHRNVAATHSSCPTCETDLTTVRGASCSTQSRRNGCGCLSCCSEEPSLTPASAPALAPAPSSPWTDGAEELASNCSWTGTQGELKAHMSQCSKKIVTIHSKAQSQSPSHSLSFSHSPSQFLSHFFLHFLS
jgi:hypothetical protein